MSKPALICMMGLPRSGKSTIVATLSKELGAPIVRRDAIRLALHGMRFKIEAEPQVKTMSLYMIRALFLAGHEVVICDETNYSKAARNSLKSPDWDIKWYPVMTGVEECKRRALATNQEDLLPIIQGMWERYEPLEATDRKYSGWAENVTPEFPPQYLLD